MATNSMFAEIAALHGFPSRVQSARKPIFREIRGAELITRNSDE
jgi:hypothetical protein